MILTATPQIEGHTILFGMAAVMGEGGQSTEIDFAKHFVLAIVLLCCIPFYILSFAQMLLPISATAKGVLWTVLFGLAKTCQYGGLTILGVEGYKRLKSKYDYPQPADRFLL